MSTTLNDLHADGIAVRIIKDDEVYAVDIQYIKDDGKHEDGEYLAGYTGIDKEDDAKFLARAFIDGYKLAKGNK